MDRRVVTEQVLAAKRAAGLSFSALAAEVGADRVWLTAALLGQHALPADLAGRVSHALGLGDDVVSLLQEIPTRGSFAVLPPADPTIYRLYEVLQVYGPALKALSHEDFGDGIMSAITFNLALERRETDAGPRCASPWTASSLPTNGRADAGPRPVAPAVARRRAAGDDVVVAIRPTPNGQAPSAGPVRPGPQAV